MIVSIKRGFYTERQQLFAGFALQNCDTDQHQEIISGNHKLLEYR